MLETQLKQQARELGFDLVGIAEAVSPSGAERLREWLAKGHAGEMAYMEKHNEARQHPESILIGVRSVVAVGMNYRTAQTSAAVEPPLAGRISNYAWGGDYHSLLRDRLNRLLAWVKEQRPECRGRGVVDTAPLLERDFARLAGLGWFGKNTMLIHKSMGSYFFIGALLLDIELQADPPFEADHCGTCTRCLDACPSDAFVAPGELDARKCISYLTIELRGPIPKELREPMGDWIFGCDVCQDVCPWNRKSPVTREPSFQPRAGNSPADLIALMRMTTEQFRARFRGTTITRTKRRGLLRNAAIALGNHRDPLAVPVLVESMADEEPLIRGAAAWALGRIGTANAIAALQARRATEADPVVQAELQAALADAESPSAVPTSS